ncbi:MAG: glycosyltransferase [Beijerinckiaceae bacterium]|nr:glycosyltransferase [Beijerinckiaceae bacterium]
MTKLAIVSSYNTLCGIAKYVARLQAALSGDFIVEIIKIDVDLLRKTSNSDRILGDNHIEEIIISLNNFDVVNIHVENGLFGSKSIDVSRRLKRLFGIEKPLFLTMHWLSPKPSFDFQSFLTDALSFRFTRIYRYFDQRYHYNLVGSSLYGQELKAHQQRKFVGFIAHSRRDRSRLQDEFGLNQIYDHPVSYLTKDEIEVIQNRASRNSFPCLSLIPENSKIYGLFGFLAPYKGIEVAIQAMNYLGHDHYLAIFGDLAPGNKETSYRDMLEKEARKLGGRVVFCGGQPEDLFLDAISTCDAVLMPYREVGLSSSGPASLALELGKRVIASDILAFRSLPDYFPGQLQFFSEGNAQDLASKIQSAQEFSSQTNIPGSSFRKNVDTYKKMIELAIKK